MNSSFWTEFKSEISTLPPQARCILLSASSSSFSFGLDLKDEAQNKSLLESGALDPAQKAQELRQFLLQLQSSFTKLEDVNQPVIACVHSYCFGSGVDLICAADIRHCTIDAKFSIKEVDVGLCPDLGTLQRLERLVGSSSLVRELAYTGRVMDALEAKACGFVSQVFSTKEEMMQKSMELARQISQKSPMAIAGIKRNLNYSRGRTVEEALEYQATWNAFALQSRDFHRGVQQALKPKIN